MTKKDYKFCPKCGGNLAYKKTGFAEYPQCKKCGFVFYINSKPATGAFIVDKQGKILLATRGVEPSKGKWDFLGGFLESGEHPVDGLKREVKEEIGVDVEVGDFLGFFMDVYNHDKVSGEYVLNIFYLCKIEGENYKLDREIAEAKWFAPDKIPWDDLAFKNTRDALNYYLNERKRNA